MEATIHKAKESIQSVAQGTILGFEVGGLISGALIAVLLVAIL